MSWTITPQTKVPVDPVFNNVSLLLHGNGANGSTTITDSSSSPKTVTAVGNAQISTAVADPFGNSTRGVLAFDGNGDYLTLPTISLTGDFTVEGYFYFNGSQDQMLFSGLANNYQIRANEGTANRLSVYATSYGAQVFIPTLALIPALQWHHIVFARGGTASRLFLNGSQVGTTVSNFTTQFEVATIGGFRNGNTFQGVSVNGYSDEIRISTCCRYTSNFTPPTAPFPDI